MTAPTLRRCTQCWQLRPLANFRGRRDPARLVRMCFDCRARYANWSAKTPEQRRQDMAPARRGLRRHRAAVRVLFSLASGNRKLGGIPASITSAETCPRSCSFFGRGCFAEYHHLRAHWATTSRRGLTWDKFCAAVRALPPGTLWRHNEAGDLPGHGDAVDLDAVADLVHANRGRRGFTFSHKPTLGDDDHVVANRAAVLWANASGLVVNLSADTLAHADQLADLGIGPVAVVVASDTPDRGLRTPGGRRVVVCPAETAARLTCAECRLCAVAHRRAVVGFRAHGQLRAEVDRLVQLRRAP